LSLRAQAPSASATESAMPSLKLRRVMSRENIGLSCQVSASRPAFVEENPKLSQVNEIPRQPFQNPANRQQKGLIAADG
jgi:hypothetical protein